MIKYSWGKVLSPLESSSLPQADPNSINPENTLNKFILYELIDTLKMMLKKINIVRSLHENKYNDIMVAILTKRLAIYGFTTNNQPRVGDSLEGKDAGSADITIGDRNQSIITTIEALKLSCFDKNKIKEHAEKVFRYDQTSKLLYIITYYTEIIGNIFIYVE